MILTDMILFQDFHLESNELFVVVSSSISFLSTLIMIVFYIAFPNLRKSSRDYLLIINLCDFLCSICFLLSGLDISFISIDMDMTVKVNSRKELNGQGYIIQFCYLSSFCWTTSYAVHLYKQSLHMSCRLQLVVYHNEIPAFCWVNQLTAWFLPIMSMIGLGILQWKGIAIIGDCDRAWQVYYQLLNHQAVDQQYNSPCIHIPNGFLIHSHFHSFCHQYCIYMICISMQYIYIRICWKSRGEAMQSSMLIRCIGYCYYLILIQLLPGAGVYIGSQWSGSRVFLFQAKSYFNNTQFNLSFSSSFGMG